MCVPSLLSGIKDLNKLILANSKKFTLADEPAMPIGDILNKNMKNICGHYKANIDDDIVNLFCSQNGGPAAPPLNTPLLVLVPDESLLAR